MPGNESGYIVSLIPDTATRKQIQNQNISKESCTEFRMICAYTAEVLVNLFIRERCRLGTLALSDCMHGLGDGLAYVVQLLRKI